jgi:acyl carrier protein
VITDTDVAQLLRDSGQLLEDWDAETELALDSLTFVWLVHLLEERHGIVVGPEDEDELAASDSIGSLHRNLVRLLPDGAGGASAAGGTEVRHAS